MNEIIKLTMNAKSVHIVTENIVCYEEHTNEQFDYINSYITMKYDKCNTQVDQTTNEIYDLLTGS